MAKYRKKPVVIEAWKITSPNDGTTQMHPSWLVAAVVGKSIVPLDDGGVDIITLEGTMRGDVGDWIIQGVKGELYPCKPDIFAATYEAA